jgi:hypothetical protein
MLLFLDFDGTLHPLWTFQRCEGSVVATPYAGPWLVEAPTLERILGPFLDKIEIVLSTAWTQTRGLDAARGLLPTALAERVSESIWLPELALDYQASRCTRFSCIQMWLERRRPAYAGPWLALDDDDELWPPDQRQHLVHAAGTLADLTVQHALAHSLAQTFARGERVRTTSS